MPAPEVRAVGASTGSAAAISPGLPTGTEAGDLLIMVCESGGPTTETEATTALTASGWTAAPKSGQVKGNTRLTIIYKIAVGSDATTTNDTGDHQMGRIIGIKKSTYNESAPFNTSAGGTQAKTKSVSIPGAETTIANCLILACASGNLPDAASTTEFGEATNASLTSITTRIGNSRLEGDGGAMYAVTGVKATAGTYNATTCTAVTEAERGVISLAISPPITTYNDSASGSVVSKGSRSESAEGSGSGAGAIASAGTRTESASHYSGAQGGLSATGSGTDSASYADSRSAAFGLTGAAGDHFEVTSAGSGVLSLAGSGIDNLLGSGEGTGVLLDSSGTGAENAYYADSRSTTFTFMGSAAEGFEARLEALGALGLTGSGADGLTVSGEGTGAFSSAGSGSENASYAEESSGTLILLPGAVAESFSGSTLAVGEIILSGAKVESYKTFRRLNLTQPPHGHTAKGREGRTTGARSGRGVMPRQGDVQ